MFLISMFWYIVFDICVLIFCCLYLYYDILFLIAMFSYFGFDIYFLIFRFWYLCSDILFLIFMFWYFRFWYLYPDTLILCSDNFVPISSDQQSSVSVPVYEYWIVLNIKGRIIVLKLISIVKLHIRELHQAKGHTI